MTTVHRLQLQKRNTLKDCTSCDDTIYPVSVYENEQDEQGRVKVHYIGYGSQYDEWKEPARLLHVDSPCAISEKFDLHQELALRIKSALLPSRKSNPSVKLIMPFDQKVFCEGLASLGYVYKSINQITKYRINQYSDLDDILGKGWHFRGLNSAGDFSFVVLKTTEYYLRHRRPLCHFIPDNNGVPLKTCIPQGYALHFTFMRGDGVPSDFGRNSTVFTKS